MKHLKRFNEAIVEWETDNIKSFYQELKDKLDNLPRLKYTLSFDDIKEVGEKYDIEVVNYDTFLNDLPTEQMKADAPPKGVPAFGGASAFICSFGTSYQDLLSKWDDWKNDTGFKLWNI